MFEEIVNNFAEIFQWMVAKCEELEYIYDLSFPRTSLQPWLYMTHMRSFFGTEPTDEATDSSWPHNHKKRSSLLENIYAQKLYRPEAGMNETYPHLQPVLSRTINIALKEMTPENFKGVITIVLSSCQSIGFSSCYRLN
ncbi:transposase [Shimazuella alba]|uniref:Uncharacterized protein n=1 Tax=Shimazuella alba TaxID=2690964 RepID=A0A6I4VQ08_9BACL|nr:transposase [Shimazuella alba]MXQ52488.1 hypothetical protein [Shimazuella alba]